jgi:UDP-2,3-diacylglucosamine pyrophosphatase LpxH
MSEQAYVVSDLHIGAGNGDALEDFTSDDKLSDFLDDIGGPGTTLIINGDFVDFARIEPLSVADVPSDLLWDETASLTKLQTALDGHRAAFAALARFLESKGQLRITVGNHDLDFAWPEVQQRFRQAVGGEGAQVIFSVGADNYAGVHIEHGHQFTPENCPRNPIDFIHTRHKRRYLERVWGTDFLLSFFNDLHRENPYADKIKPTILLAYHALKNRWIPPSALVKVVLFMKRRGIPLDGVISSVLDEADIPPRSLVGAFEEAQWRWLADQAVRADPQGISKAIATLSDEDRAVLRLPVSVTVGAEVDLIDGGAETLGLIRDGREARAARERLSHAGVTSVVFGHTHQVQSDLDDSHFNPGTWIPYLNLRDQDVRAKMETRGITRELLSDESLYRVSRCAVLIRPDRHRSRVQVIDKI